MFKLGRQVESALLALSALEKSRSSLSISELSEKHQLSKNTLSKVMQVLQKEGIVDSNQGVKGGYQLSSPLRQFSFFQLLKALGEIQPLACTGSSPCSLASSCSIKDPLVSWEHKFENFLKNTTLSELTSQGPSSPGPETKDVRL